MPKDPSALIKDLEERLAESERRREHLERLYAHFVDRTHGLICTHDLEGRLLSINPTACEALGYPSSELIGRNLRELVPEKQRPYFDDFLARMREAGDDKGVLKLVTRDGRRLTFQYHNIVMRPEGEEPYVLGFAYDITELTDLQKRLQDLTVTDDLTELYNRRGFLARAEERIEMARRSGERLMMIVADVDGLKKVNDKYGHAFGSQMIVDTAHILRDSFRQTDIISRWGGDEFVVLLGTAMRSGPNVAVDRVQKKIAAFNAASGHPYTLSVSLGIAPIDITNGVDLADVFKRADEAMYRDKRSKQDEQNSK